MSLVTTPSRVVRTFGLIALALLASCRETDLVTETAGPDPEPVVDPSGVHCAVNVRAGTVNCASAAGAVIKGADARIVGGQGVNVRLASSGIAYVGTAFSFNVSVQNLVDLAMASLDGATREDDGVRVFFQTVPTVTSGSGVIDVLNETGNATFLAANQDYFQYGGKIGGIDQTHLGADGILSSGEVSTAVNWQFDVPLTVVSFGFTVFVSSQTPSGAITSVAPQVQSINVPTLFPGASVTLTGTGFDAAFANNTVTIGGRTATVTGGNTTSLQVTVPCVKTGSVAVNAAIGNRQGASVTNPLQALQLSAPIGTPVIVSNAAELNCSELPATGTAAKYVVAVFSNSTSTASNSPFTIAGDGIAEPTPSANLNASLIEPDLSSLPAALRQANELTERSDELHYNLLEKNRLEGDRLRARFPNESRKDELAQNRMPPVAPPLTRVIRMSNLNTAGSICSNFISINATRVYYNGKIAIYEDADSTPAGFQAALNPTMQDYYNRIGDQFNADMEPIINANFGDVLARDAITDNNGVLVALFTPLINNRFGGVAGFVVSCDQFPNDSLTSATNTSSNYGQYFYAYQPNVAGTGYGGTNNPDQWFRTVRSTFIHETKHVVAQATRVQNGAPFEVSWLEEGTARHSEELWGRNAVDNLAWKGNNGFGSAASPVNIYCDHRPSGFAECLTNPRRPANIMQRHFSSLYTHLFGTNARLFSPFGPTANDNASYFYAISWSLVRYAIDRYGVSDAAFLTGLVSSSQTGANNLAAQAGVTIEELLGGWNLALALDDRADVVSPHLNALFQTWNFRSIYAGFNGDFPATYTLAYPLVPAAAAFGQFAPTTITTLRGGGALWYELGGTVQSEGQAIGLSGNGVALPANVRMAIMRIQ